MAVDLGTARVDLGLGGNYSDVVLADSPVGYWRLGEFSGTTADDSSGNNRDGTFTGPVLGVRGALPENNAAARFDGSNDYADMGDVSAFAFTGAFSVEAWVKFTSATGQRVIANKSNFETTAVGWSLFMDSGVHAGSIGFFVRATLLTVLVDINTHSAGGHYNDGLWHHVVATWTGDTTVNGAKLYVDGALIVQGTAAAGAAGTPAVPMRVGIGSNGTTSTFAWAGDIDEVALYGAVLSAARVLAHYTAGSWTNVRADVLIGEPISWKRGAAAGATPTNRTAEPGSLEFTLRNDSGNSGGLQGYYSPYHVNCRSGFTYGIPVRVVITNSGTDYVLWTGKLRVIDPLPGQNRTQRTRCSAEDAFNGLTEAKVRQITPQLSQSETALIAAVIGALAAGEQPPAIDLDTALDSYTYALDNAGEGAAPIGLLNDIAVSALGWIYPLGDGTLVYENRHTRTTAVSSFTLDADADGDDVVVPSSLRGVYNRVRASIHPKTTTAAIVLYRATGAIPVSAGQTVTVWGTYQDPNNVDRLIGASATTTPLVASTDYVGNSQSDGLGTDRTASLSITATPFLTTCKFDITNSYTDVVYVTTLQIRGTGIFDNTPQVFESYAAMDYGDRPLNIDLKYQDDPNVGQDLADYLTSLLSAPSQIDAVQLKANRSSALLTQVLTRDIGDVITISETVTGVASLVAAIAGLEMTITEGSLLTCRWNLSPQTATGALVLDDAVFGVLDAPEAVLGYA
jgi:hypothetical protein